ncbi:hypothetical protein BGX28_007063 [Mortierella sp. GBA30]|nr:hypothetical protein BGX28_007063 [Mortierella sp. GBA30]
MPISCSTTNSSNDSLPNSNARIYHHHQLQTLQDATQSLKTIVTIGQDVDDTTCEDSHNRGRSEPDPSFWRPSYDGQEADDIGKGSSKGNDSGIKSGSKLSKGWKRLRQSLRHSAMAGQRGKHLSGSLSSVAEGRKSESALSLGEERKTMSDMDRPLEIGTDDTLNFGPGFGAGFSSKFGSGSLKGFMMKGTSATASLAGSDSSDTLAPKMICYKDSPNDLEGGAVVVDVETVMSLGKMRQYGREDRMLQQKSQQTRQQDLSAPAIPPPPDLGHVSKKSHITANHAPAMGVVQSTSETVDISKEDQKHLTVMVIGPEGCPIQDETGISAKQLTDKDHVAKEAMLDKIVDSEPSIIPRAHRLGHDLSSSQRWRLSARGSPDVYGSICERAMTDSCANELFLQRLMRDSTIDRSNLESKPTLEESDRQDNIFRVPLEQSVQLASAMFDNGQKIPLVVYYVTEELRVRGDIIAVIESLFPEDWDTKDSVFEALVNVFDNRPFGQDVNLSTVSLNAQKETETLISTESRGEGGTPQADTGLLEDQNSSQSALDDMPRAVSSRDLSRVILRFLADLPEPLIPQDVFSTFSAMVQLQTLDSIKIQASSLLIQLLSVDQRHILQFLLEFLDIVVLGSLRENIERLERHVKASSHADPTQEHQNELEQRQHEYRETMERISKILGIVCVQAGFSGNRAGDSPAMATQGQNSLYRHYKKEFELQVLQEQKAAVIQQAKEVFHSLLKFRVSVFGPSSFSFTGSAGSENGLELNSEDQQRKSGILQEDPEQDQDSATDVESEYEYQSDSALMDRPHSMYLSKRRAFPRPKSSFQRYSSKTTGLNRQSRRRAQSSKLFGRAGRGAMDGHDTQKGALCDSGTDLTTNVDLFAIAAMQEHAARALRSNKHLPRPSVATLHSVLAEAESVVGTTQSLSGGRRLSTALDSDCLNGQSADDDEGENKDVKDNNENLGYGTKKLRREYGFMDFLQEPLDRKREEREIKMVEEEILQSELTTKFLAANLVGLYPSSSPSPIPPVILPSARSSLQQPPILPNNSPHPPEPESPYTIRELQLVPQKQIHLPLDHRATDDCTCSFCTTMIKPSKIPVMTREEYERAELQSQCEAKDQHIAELLKTVQSLQNQVNILNAKLLFLHDHHTTRPMRRRPLVRNSQPVMPTAGGVQWFSRQNQHQLMQRSSCSDDSQRGLGISSAIQTGSTITLATTQSCSSPISGSPKTFAEGVHGNDLHLSRSRVASQQYALGHGIYSLEADETMSFLDLEDNPSLLPPPPPPPPPLPPSSSFPVYPVHQQNQAQMAMLYQSYPVSNGAVNNPRRRRYETELERVLRDVEEAEEEEEREREGEDTLDEYYYMDAYKTMDQQLHRRPILPVSPPPRPMSADQYRKHHRMSLPIQNLMSKRISLANSFHRWKGRTNTNAG